MEPPLHIPQLATNPDMMKPHGEFVLTEHIPAPPQAVYDYFSNPECTKDLQPYVKAVDVQQDGVVNGIRIVKTYSVEYVPIFGGLWKQRNGIKAEWKHTAPPHTLEVRAYSKPGVHLHITYTFAPAPENHTQLSEHIRYRAPLLLRNITEREGRRAQTELLRRLRAHFTTSH